MKLGENSSDNKSTHPMTGASEAASGDPNNFGGNNGNNPRDENVDVNKVNHIFGKPEHNLDGIVRHFGSREAAYAAVRNATESTVRARGITGLFETTVDVAGAQVTVRGKVVNGAVKIGTAFIP
jgi:hypothetical protein